MKINELLSNESINEQLIDNQKKTEKEKNSNNEATKLVIDELFESLIAIYPAYKQSWPTQEVIDSAKKQWLISFVDSNLTDIAQIKKGLAKARESESEFIPSPGRFISWCFDIKPQSDTIDRSYMFVKGIESDEHKARKREIALKNLSEIRKKLY